MQNNLRTVGVVLFALFLTVVGSTAYLYLRRVREMKRERKPAPPSEPKL